MKHLSEYRHAPSIIALTRSIKAKVKTPLRLLEVCGGQTQSIRRNGLDALLNGSVTFVHGPGCPVCVTPEAAIDAACHLAKNKSVVLCSYGDMLRVPGSSESLLEVRAAGGDVRVIRSPMEAAELAILNPQREVILFAIGFETTAPANAATLMLAKQKKLKNFSTLVAQVRVPPILSQLFQSKELQIDGLLAAGHVCAIDGEEPYTHLAAKHRVPIVITGFEPVDILLGVSRCIDSIQAHQFEVNNAYKRVADSRGNRSARFIVEQVFEITDSEWRGLGVVPKGGLQLREGFHTMDAMIRFGLNQGRPPRSPTGQASHSQTFKSASRCLAADILKGRLSPPDCPHFGVSCTPSTPLGAPMVSTEGACAAYHNFGVPKPSSLAHSEDTSSATFQTRKRPANAQVQ